MENRKGDAADSNTCQKSVEFDILEIGCSGNVEIVSRCEQTSISDLPPLSTLPSGLPPLFPVGINNELQEYLLHPEKLPIHDFCKTQRYFDNKRNPESLYFSNECAVQTSLEVERNPLTGELLGYNEVALSNTGDTGRNSMSLLRLPGALSDSVKGQSTNYPFLPGGMESRESKQQDVLKDIKVDLENDLLCQPPGFNNAITFGRNADIGEKGETSSVAKAAGAGEVISVVDILANSSLEDLEFSDDESKLSDTEPQMAEGETTEENKTGESEVQESLDNILPEEDTGGKVAETSTPSSGTPAKEEWAAMVDVSKPVKNFHKHVPEMAYQWPFKLDKFQEHAILRLELHESVFVAAHTSAGKTVVAEYAIALASKHMTRTIYTSPIKALSNQKFRDFKKTFEDVGLVTGDVQINPEASCLIMTTEILRSMLYNGSDVIRDVEWVIFDEVHYVNDAERGVVWEEVLIMLPPHVNIILLSATVPNTLEFANWIGQTKKKKLYVISTRKRPVPLQHFLYTGNSNKTSNEQFMIVSEEGQFLTRGYQAAIDAKKERASKRKEAFGAKGARFSANPKQDRNVWLSLIEMLRKKDKLPVVAFTFSRKRCEENADHLLNLDLTTNKEKKDIQVFLHKCVSRLKGTDAHLPQVTRMQELLKHGLAVHHSGVLPIIKEMVEMLFQRGLVKLLFATETFAMGVNMPARTVVFDSIRKHDGTNFRDLLPGEYIQMAGRAGRRGLDTTGTVIILCKGDVPEMADLHKMMLGKPTKLESRFRLTYSMILNLLRVEELRVEDMMKRSFAEFYMQCDADERRKAVKELEERLANTKDVDCMVCQLDLKDYYGVCSELRGHTEVLQAAILASPHGQRALSAGRVLVVDTADQKNVLAVLLQNEASSSKGYSSFSQPVSSGSQGNKFTVLVICDADVTSAKNVFTEGTSSPHLSSLEPYNRRVLFRPQFRCSHKIVKITGQQIAAITVQHMKINAAKILEGQRRATMSYLRNEPPCQSAVMAEQQLLRLTESNPEGLETMDVIKDFNIRDIDLVQAFKRQQTLEKMTGNFHCINCPKFSEHFHQLDEQLLLQKRLSHLKYLLSDQSLQLLPEYHCRIQVLNMLHYIKSNNTVELKGRVACEISNHELMITELVFESVFTDLHPAEIVALLSCFVFEQKRCSEPKLTKELEMGKQRILDTASRIATIQTQNGMDTPEEDFKRQFHFGLVEVVFEWARGMPFAEITNLTDVQEGIIVRCIQRLNETCRDVRNAAKIIGDPVLHQKMEEASTLIKRDIVFAASLYTQ